jgi:hypothetical protein
MPAGMQQAHRDAARAVEAAGPVGINPDALRAAVNADLAEQPRRQPAWAAGREEPSPHRLATRAFLETRPLA